MLKIKQISFRNFRSYGKVDTVVNFETPGTTLLTGKNDDGGTTNGQGKTSVLFALTWLLYDKVIDSINKDELINTTNKVDMYGEVSFSVKGEEVTVKRWRKGGKGNRENGAALIINGEDKTPAGNDNINKKIQELIGIDFELFSRIVVYSATNKSFFDLPSTSHYESNQTDMVEQLFNLQLLSEKAVALKAQIKSTESELVTQKRLIEQAEKQLTSHKTLVEKTESRKDAWEQSRVEDIAALNADLELIEHVDFDEERKHHTVITECSATKREVASEKRIHESKVTTVTRQVKELIGEVAALADSTCPYCKQEFAGAAEKRKHVQEQLAKSTELLANLNVEIQACDEELRILDGLIANSRKKTTVNDFDHLVELKATHADLVTKLTHLKDQLNPHTETLQELIDAQPVVPEFEAVNQLATLNEHQQFLLKLLTKKDSFLRKALLHKNIPLLNERMAYYLDCLGLPHTVEFLPSLTANITQFGRELSFGMLSNGQKARVNFALSLAFGDLLQKIHQKINIQLFDEVLDIGLDAHGISAASRLLKRKARDEGLAIFVITHRDELANAFDNQLIVKQKDGFSYVEVSSNK
jgi:DNA repair exonuclease SbcCD ATPase subunit